MHGRVFITLGIAIGLVVGTHAHASQFLDGALAGRNYKLYVPSGYSGAPLPLVLMLHGCTQDPADFAAGTQMNTIAEANGFFVLYPEQSASDNLEKCWTWYDPANQVRGSGEPAQIIGILDQVEGAYQVDATRVFVAGLSAGAAMTTILGATYPDRFAAIASSAGLEYAASQSVATIVSAQAFGGPAPMTQGLAAFSAMGKNARRVRVFVVQGSADVVVAPVNGDQVLSQWAETDDLASDGVDDDNIDDTPSTTSSGQAPGGRAYTLTTYMDHTAGDIALEKLIVTGMNHAWSGGSIAGTYTDPAGPNASQMIWDFFSTVPAMPMTTPDGGSADAAVTPDAAMTPKAPSGCSYGEHGAPGLYACALVLLGLVASRKRRSN